MGDGYVAGITESFTPENTLTPERQAELVTHFHECEISGLACPLCRELYDNLGYREYLKLTESHPEDYELV
jgi:hypothetical protein